MSTPTSIPTPHVFACNSLLFQGICLGNFARLRIHRERLDFVRFKRPCPDLDADTLQIQECHVAEKRPICRSELSEMNRYPPSSNLAGLGLSFDRQPP